MQGLTLEQTVRRLSWQNSLKESSKIAQESLTDDPWQQAAMQHKFPWLHLHAHLWAQPLNPTY
jgi:hypothetical protein